MDILVKITMVAMTLHRSFVWPWQYSAPQTACLHASASSAFRHMARTSMDENSLVQHRRRKMDSAANPAGSAAGAMASVLEASTC